MASDFQGAITELSAGLSATFRQLWPKPQLKYQLDDTALRLALLTATMHFIADVAQEQSLFTDEVKNRLIQRIDKAIADTMPLNDPLD